MKKSIIYVVIAACIGLFAGYLIFGDKAIDSSMNTGSHDHASEHVNQKWTCSMHPQIMQPTSGNCPICGMDLIPMDIETNGLSPEQFRMTKNALALANIQTQKVGEGTTNENTTISLSGKIAVNEEAMSIQASYFTGRIERLYVNYEGEKVRKGQLLATIYAPELITAQQELLTAVSLKESQPLLYKAVRNKLKLWKLSENQINTIESSGKITENLPIYTTVSGTVTKVMSTEGDYVKQGQPILELSNLNTVWAAFDIYEDQISQFEKGQKISITTNAYFNKKFEGVLSFIDPIINKNTRTTTIRVVLDNSHDLFKPGMFVEGVVGVSQKKSRDLSLLIPSSAVLWTGKRSLVYAKAKQDEPVFEMREVMLGEKRGEHIEIISGLKPGEEIVTHGTFTVDAAAQLQGKKSMMNFKNENIMTEGSNRLNNQDDKKESENEIAKMQLPTAFQKEFKLILPLYLKLKDALVLGDSKQANKESKDMLSMLNNLDLSKDSKYLKKSIEMLHEMVKTDNLKSQREYFVMFNENFITIVDNLEFSNNTLYIQQCPMANRNQGAVWLSAEKEIRNPYFGDQMLRCGSIIDTIQ